MNATHRKAFGNGGHFVCVFFAFVKSHETQVATVCACAYLYWSAKRRKLHELNSHIVLWQWQSDVDRASDVYRSEVAKWC